jgi:hypothetical protein
MLKYHSLHQYTRGSGGGFKYTPKVAVTEYYQQIENELSAQNRDVTVVGHVTHAHSHMNAMYTPLLLRKVRHLYRKDYLFLDRYT